MPNPLKIEDILFLFALGNVLMYFIEVIFKKFHEGKLENPGFLKGPYLPIYGFALIFLYYISSLEISLFLKLIILFIFPSILELFAGLLFLNYFNFRIWNYTAEPYNYRGVIVLWRSIVFGLLSLIFYFGVYPILIRVMPYASSPGVINVLIIFYIVYIIDLIFSVKRNLLQKR